MSLRSQRRIAAEILKVGANRVWIDPEETEKVSSAITRGEVRRLIHEGIVGAAPKTGISRGRKRLAHQKKLEGRMHGPGSRKGPRSSQRALWIPRIRVLRIRLRQLRDRRMISTGVYRRLLLMAKGGTFRNLSHLSEYIETHKLAKRR